MKSHRYASASALCPYYKAQDAQLIYCAGFREGQAIHLAFSVPSGRKDYSKSYCESCWETCPIAAERV